MNRELAEQTEVNEMLRLIKGGSVVERRGKLQQFSEDIPLRREAVDTGILGTAADNLADINISSLVMSFEPSVQERIGTVESEVRLGTTNQTLVKTIDDNISNTVDLMDGKINKFINTVLHDREYMDKLLPLLMIDGNPEGLRLRNFNSDFWVIEWLLTHPVDSINNVIDEANDEFRFQNEGELTDEEMNARTVEHIPAGLETFGDVLDDSLNINMRGEIKSVDETLYVNPSANSSLLDNLTSIFFADKPEEERVASVFGASDSNQLLLGDTAGLYNKYNLQFGLVNNDEGDDFGVEIYDFPIIEMDSRGEVHTITNRLLNTRHWMGSISREIADELKDPGLRGPIPDNTGPVALEEQHRAELKLNLKHLAYRTVDTVSDFGSNYLNLRALKETKPEDQLLTDLNYNSTAIDSLSDTPLSEFELLIEQGKRIKGEEMRDVLQDSFVRFRRLREVDSGRTDAFQEEMFGETGRLDNEIDYIYNDFHILTLPEVDRSEAEATSE